MKSKLKVNFLYSSVYQILLIILPLITAPYVSRVLGSEGVGIYSYSYSIASCFAMFGILGIANYGNRIIAINRDDKDAISKIFSDIWTIQMCMTGFTLVIYIIYIVCVANPIYKGVLLIQILTILCSCADVSWFFFGLEEFKLTVIRNLVIKIITTILIFILVRKKSDVMIYVFILCSGTLMGNLSLFPFLKHYIAFVKPSLKRMREHFPSILVLFIPVLAVTLYKKMDKIMLGVMSTMSQTGYYENAEKIINIPMGIITALGTVMMPRISYLIEKGEKKQVSHYMNISIELTFFLASALMFGIAGISKEFVPLFFGNTFNPVIGVMKILSLTILFVSLANIFRAQYLIPKHYDKVYIVSVWAGAVINLLLNYIFIPKYAALGASCATVIAEATVMLIQMFYVWRELPILQYIKQGIGYIFSGSLMFIAVRVVAGCMSGWNGVLLQIFVGILTYFIISGSYIIVKHKTKLSIYLKNK